MIGVNMRGVLLFSKQSGLRKITYFQKASYILKYSSYLYQINKVSKTKCREGFKE